MTNWDTTTYQSATSRYFFRIIGKPHRSHRHGLMLTIGTNTSPPIDLATFDCPLVSNHPHRQLSYRPVSFAPSCRSTLYRSWVRVQKRCQQFLWWTFYMYLLMPSTSRISWTTSARCHPLKQLSWRKSVALLYSTVSRRRGRTRGALHMLNRNSALWSCAMWFRCKHKCDA